MDKIKRHADWQARAKAVIEAAKDKPFAYGRLDGVLFTGNVLKAITGRDVLRGMRGYRSLRGGLKNLKALVYPIDKDWLKTIPLLVISSRMADIAASMHLGSELICAENATDAAIVEALEKWSSYSHAKRF